MLVISMLLVHGSRSAWSSSVLLLLDDLPGVYEPFFRAPFRGCESGGGGLNAPPPSHIVDGVDGAIFQLCQLSRGEREAANKSWFALWKRASLIRVCVVSSVRGNTHERKELQPAIRAAAPTFATRSTDAALPRLGPAGPTAAAVGVRGWTCGQPFGHITSSTFNPRKDPPPSP